MIEVRDLVVHRGSSRVLSGITLDAKPGHVTAIIGANGAGKSTLMRTLAGDLSAESGEVRIHGLGVTPENAATLATKRAILSQATSLLFAFRVFDVVELGRIPQTRSSGSADEARIIGECLERAGVAHLRSRSYPSLSGGEKQRVQLARALAQVWNISEKERVLLLDEPTSALDLRHQQSTLSLVRNLADAGSTIVVVLHDLNLAARYADTCILLHEGNILANGTPRTDFTEANLRAAFGVHTTIIRHPEYACPLIVTLDPTNPEPTKAPTQCTPRT